MKLFSLAWKASSKAAKQRKYRANAPLHLKRTFMAAPVAKELQARYGTKTVTLREGDTVRIMKGQFKGTTGKVNSVNTRRGIVYVDGAGRTRKDGTKSYFPMQPFNVLLVEAAVEDKKRAQSLSRNKGEEVKFKWQKSISKD